MHKYFSFLFALTLTISAMAQKPFITVWKTDNQGATANNQIKFPGNGPSYKVEWQEDGSIENKGMVELSGKNNIITFPKPGTYLLKAFVSDETTFSQEFSSTGDDNNKLIEVKQWGDVKWSNMKNAFQYCKNLDVTATDIPNLKSVTSMGQMFYGCENLIGNNSFNNWNISNVEDLHYTFGNCYKFNQPVGNWNTENVISMYATFQEASSFNQPLAKWNTGKVNSMFKMFYRCVKFNQPIGSWDVSKVDYFSHMFEFATAFNQDLSNWKMKDFAEKLDMLRDAYSYKGGVSDEKDVTVKNKTNSQTKKETAKVLTSPKKQKVDVTNTSSGTKAAYSLALQKDNAILDKKAFVTIWKIEKQDVYGKYSVKAPVSGDKFTVEVIDLAGKIEKKSELLLGESQVLTFPDKGTYAVKINADSGIAMRLYAENSLDLIEIAQWGKINWSKADGAFRNCTNMNLTATDVPNLDNITDISLMFCRCKSLVGNSSFNKWETRNITNMFGMFIDCPLFNQNIGNWNTSNVTKMAMMFQNATSFNQNIENWDVSKVQDMGGMFSYAGSFNKPLAKWNTTNVQDMRSMFNNANSFNQPIGNWNVSNVNSTNGMAHMFSDAKSFNQPIGNWNVSNVKNFNAMFWNAKAFNQDLSKWNLISAEETKFMFDGATSYKGIKFNEVSITEQNMARWRREKEEAERLAKQELINAANKGNDCIQSIRIGMKLASEKYDKWKRACTNEFEYSVSGSNVAFHTTELIVVLRRVKETVGLGVCNSLASEERTRLRDLIDKKIKGFEEFESDYKRANKKPSIWEVLIGGLQIATGTYE